MEERQEKKKAVEAALDEDNTRNDLLLSCSEIDKKITAGEPLHIGER